MQGPRNTKSTNGREHNVNGHVAVIMLTRNQTRIVPDAQQVALHALTDGFRDVE